MFFSGRWMTCNIESTFYNCSSTAATVKSDCGTVNRGIRGCHPSTVARSTVPWSAVQPYGRPRSATVIRSALYTSPYNYLHFDVLSIHLSRHFILVLYMSLNLSLHVFTFSTLDYICSTCLSDSPLFSLFLDISPYFLFKLSFLFNALHVSSSWCLSNLTFSSNLRLCFHIPPYAFYTSSLQLTIIIPVSLRIISLKFVTCLCNFFACLSHSLHISRILYMSLYFLRRCRHAFTTLYTSWILKFQYIFRGMLSLYLFLIITNFLIVCRHFFWILCIPYNFATRLSNSSCASLIFNMPF